MKRAYTDEHAQAGISAELPEIETWPNQYPGYEIEVVIPEFTSVCPKTGLPDFGKLTLRYTPDKLCLELKSLKLYLWSYRNEGAFHEAVTNRILDDIVAATQPRFIEVVGDFLVRGGIHTVVTVRRGESKAEE